MLRNLSKIPSRVLLLLKVNAKEQIEREIAKTKRIKTYRASGTAAGKTRKCGKALASGFWRLLDVVGINGSQRSTRLQRYTLSAPLRRIGRFDRERRLRISAFRYTQKSWQNWFKQTKLALLNVCELYAFSFQDGAWFSAGFLSRADPACLINRDIQCGCLLFCSAASFIFFFIFFTFLCCVLL